MLRRTEIEGPGDAGPLFEFEERCNLLLIGKAITRKGHLWQNNQVFTTWLDAIQHPSVSPRLLPLLKSDSAFNLPLQHEIRASLVRFHFSERWMGLETCYTETLCAHGQA